MVKPIIQTSGLQADGEANHLRSDYKTYEWCADKRNKWCVFLDFVSIHLDENLNDSPISSIFGDGKLLVMFSELQVME